MSAGLVREAVAAGDYEAARARFAEYARGLPVTEESVAEMRALLEWTRTAALCARSHAEDRLQLARAELRAISAYSR